jgi:hypothetical protein
MLFLKKSLNSQYKFCFELLRRLSRSSQQGCRYKYGMHYMWGTYLINDIQYNSRKLFLKEVRGIN